MQTSLNVVAIANNDTHGVEDAGGAVVLVRADGSMTTVTHTLHQERFT